MHTDSSSQPIEALINHARAPFLSTCSCERHRTVHLLSNPDQSACSLPAEAGPSQIPNGGASCSSNTHQSDVALLAAENEALRARLAALMAATFADDSLEDAAVAGGAGAGRLGYM